MKILAICPLTFMDVQIEIHKAFVYTLMVLSKRHEVTMIVDQRKRFLRYQNFGWLDKLEKHNVKTIFTGNVLKNFDTTTKNYEIDYSFLDKFGKQYDEIFIYSPPICGGSVIKTCSYKNYDKYRYCSFNSMSSKYNSYIIINSLINKYNLKVKHLIVDYLEPRFSDYYENCVTFGNYKHKDIKTMYLFENYLFRKGIIEKEKKYKFYFGYTVTYKCREYLSKLISENVTENEDFKITCNDKYWKGVGRKDAVNQTEYYDLIAQTKFSLLAPSNNIEEVSYIRILECLSRNCIPIIMSNVKIEKCFDNFPELFEFYKTNKLFYNIDGKISINDFVNKLDYDKLLKKLHQLNTIKKFKDKEFMQNKMLNNYERW